MRHLVLKLEVIDNLELAHPFIKGFEKTVVCYDEQQAIDAGNLLFTDYKNLIGRGIFHSANPPTDSKEPTSTPPSADILVESGRTVCTTTFYVGLAITKAPATTGEEKTASSTRKLDIGWPTQDFTAMCKAWEKYDENSMGICVKYVKRYF